ncbi:MAG: DUF3048 domain-containing protein [bacterium]
MRSALRRPVSLQMIGLGDKTVRRQSDARRTVFAVDADFWRGPAGWVLVVLMTMVGVGAISFAYWSDDDSCGSIPVDTSSSDGALSEQDGLLPSDRPRSAIDGRSLAEQEDGRLFAVTIDNIAVARPSASVAAASLVWEAPVEGGITRLLILVRDGAGLRRIGPVRSVRPYFIDWAEEYGAVMTHVGGSPQALQELHDSGWPELDEMRNGGYFWRDRSRSAPHNAYTSSDLLHESLDDFDFDGHEVKLDTDRPFRVAGAEYGDTDEIEITFGAAEATVTWTFDRDTGTYLRHQGSGKFKDENGTAVMANNIVVQFTDISVIDSVGRRSIRTSGTGAALVIRDGLVLDARWSKQDGGRTRFVDPKTGDEIALNVGTTWIEVVDGVDSVSY